MFEWRIWLFKKNLCGVEFVGNWYNLKIFSVLLNSINFSIYFSSSCLLSRRKHLIYWLLSFIDFTLQNWVYSERSTFGIVVFVAFMIYFICLVLFLSKYVETKQFWHSRNSCFVYFLKNSLYSITWKTSFSYQSNFKHIGLYEFHHSARV